MSLIYLGGAIDLVSHGERHSWRGDMNDKLRSLGFSTYDPAKAFNINLEDHGVTKELIGINHYAMMSSDITILVMTPDHASIGTPMELLMLIQEEDKDFLVIWNPKDYAEIPNMSIPVSVVDVYKRDNLPKALPAYISGFTNNVVSSFRDALAYISFRRGGVESDRFFNTPMKAGYQPMQSTVPYNFADVVMKSNVVNKPANPQSLREICATQPFQGSVHHDGNEEDGFPD